MMSRDSYLHFWIISDFSKHWHPQHFPSTGNTQTLPAHPCHRAVCLHLQTDGLTGEINFSDSKTQSHYRLLRK